MGGSVFVSPGPGSLVGDVRQSTRQRRGFQCPAEDKDGSPNTGESENANANGSNSSVTLVCSYNGGAGDCVYDGVDGTFESGSPECPDGNEATTPSSTTIIQTSTQIQTQTQTQIVTQTVQSLPPSSTSTPPASTPSSTSSLTSSSASNSQPSLSASSAPPTSSAPMATQTNDTGLSGSGVTLSSTKSVTAGAIAGIVVGSIIVLILAIVLALCVRRTRRRRSMTSLVPESYLVVNPTTTSESTPTRMTENSRHLSVSDVSQQRQEYLASRLRAVQKELEALQASVGTGGEHLEQAMRQNEALRARIRMLEREMQSQWGLGLTDSPPAYLD